MNTANTQPSDTYRISKEWRLRAYLGIAFTGVFIVIALVMLLHQTAPVGACLLIIAALLYFDYPYIRLLLQAGDITVQGTTLHTKSLAGTTKSIDTTQVARVEAHKIFSGKGRPLFAFKLTDQSGNFVYLAASAITKAQCQQFGHDFARLAQQYLFTPQASWDKRAIALVTPQGINAARYISQRMFSAEDLAVFQAHFGGQPTEY